MTTQPVDWLAIAPALCILGAGILALLADAFAPRRGPWLVLALAGVGVVAGVGFLSGLSGSPRSAFCLRGNRPTSTACSWQLDHVVGVWWLAVLLATGLVIAMMAPSLTARTIPAGEAVLLLMSSAAGAMSVAASGDLVTLVVSMEAVSLPAFALVGLRRRSRRGAEAALKFFIVSVVSTAVTLLGISLVYGATGSLASGPVAASIATNSALRPVVAVGLVLTIVGLGFKVAAVPFQAWVPDTYVGAPIPVAAYLSVVSKAAGLAGVAVVLVRFAPAEASMWRPVVGVIAALTMTVGNVAALQQRHAVRLLAWSSVAQAGYLLVPIAAGGSAYGIGALQVYLLMYAVVNIAAFAVVLAVSSAGGVVVDDFEGLARSKPLLGIGLVFALLCLAGLPPGVVGLLAKVVVFQSAIDGHASWLAVVMAINVAIGLVYYLRWLVVVIRPQHVARHVTVSTPVALVVALTTVAAVVLSIVPGPLFSVM